MAFLVVVGVWIASAVATAISVIVISLLTVVANIVAIVGAVAGAVACTTITLITGLIKAVTFVGGLVVKGLMSTYTFVKPYMEKVYHIVATLANEIFEATKTFLEAIHFKTILKIHKILELTSPSYRYKMRKFYEDISEVSSALGLGANFLNLALQNARNVVLDVSSLMGRKYDMAEITWLGEMNKFLTKMSPQMERFAEDPARLFEWLNQYIYRPAIDAKGTFQQTLLGVLDGVTTVVDNVTGKVITLREDLDQAILQLPPKISEKLYKEFKPRFEKFDKFIEEEYRPVATTITNIMHVISETTESHTTKLGNLTRSILNPGDLLSNIDHLPELERLRQEAQIGEISTRSTNREIKKINEKIKDTYKGIHEIFEASVLSLPPVPYHVPEIHTLAYPIGKIPVGKKSWFVGDF